MKKERNTLGKIILGFLLAIFILQSCSREEPTPYNPILQLEVDLRLIDEYVAANNLTVEIEPNSNIRYIIENEGNSIVPESGDTVYVNYELSLLDGTFIDTSIEQSARDNGIFNESRNYQPFGFIIGQRTVVPGFEVGTLLLAEGGTGNFFIPSVFGYANRGSGNIPPNTNLNFKISITEIRK